VSLRESIIAGKLPTKTVGTTIYLHLESLINLGSDAHRNLKEILCSVFGKDIPEFNILKVEENDSTLSLLNYPNFYDEPFPALAESRKIDTISKAVTYRAYTDSSNPPIFHRKELLISPSNSHYEEYRALTSAAESLGLFENPKQIGYYQQWNKADEYRYGLLPW
jgi:hypothetical protein